MKLFYSLPLLATTSAFTFTPSNRNHVIGVKLSAQKLSAAEMIAAQRKELMESNKEQASPFGDGLKNDMVIMLDILEKRVKDGERSLTKDEVELFAETGARVLSDMKKGSISSSSSSSVVEAVVAPVVAEEEKPAPPPPPPLTAVNSKEEVVQDLSNDEGPAWDGRGGMGQARGTRNTYYLAGMEEMSPEEYRAALQRSVIEAQEKRRRSRGGIVGNRSAHHYLDSIGYGGNSSLWGNENDREKTQDLPSGLPLDELYERGSE